MMIKAKLPFFGAKSYTEYHWETYLGASADDLEYLVYGSTCTITPHPYGTNLSTRSWFVGRFKDYEDAAEYVRWKNSKTNWLYVTAAVLTLAGMFLMGRAYGWHEADVFMNALARTLAT
jgi:hypothetical protein